MIGQSIGVAFKSIWTKKLRSLLTMLGVIIGVGAVIALIALGSGSGASIANNIRGLGSNLIVANVGVSPLATTNSSSLSTATPPPLTAAQANDLGDMKGVSGAAPVMTDSGTLAVGTESTTSQIIGTNAKYLTIMGYHVAEGRFLSPLDVSAANSVIVLASSEATSLFGHTDPVGNTVSLNGVPFRVVGVLAAKASDAGDSSDDFGAIPWTTAETLFGSSAGITTVDLSAATHANSTQVVTRIENKLFAWLGSPNDYTVTAQSQILSTLSSVTKETTLLLGGVAGISLIVGGIGIMNIMLVSVTERTREIGIRKAIGASTGNILFQFLIESLVLAGVGGLLGVGVGILGAHIMHASFGMSTIVSPDIPLLSFGFALAVGLIFGLWPATRASLLRPADALRSE